MRRGPGRNRFRTRASVPGRDRALVDLLGSRRLDVLWKRGSDYHVKLDENMATYLGSSRLPVIYSKAQVHGARTTQGIAVRFTFLAIDLDSVTNSLFLEYISNQVYFQF